MKKRSFSFILAILVLTMMLMSFTSCGGGAKTSSEVKDAVEITFGVLNNTSEMAIAKAFVDEFAKVNSSAKVKIVGITDVYNTWMTRMIASETLPDVVFTLDDRLDYFANNGAFEPLNERFKAAGLKESDYFESVFASAKPLADGELYYFPRDYNRVVTFINTEMWTAAGLDPASYKNWTWEEYKAVAKKFDNIIGSETKPKEFAQATSASDAQLGWGPIFNTIVRSFGGEIFDIKNGAAKFDDSNTQKALNEMVNLVKNNLSIAPSATGSNLFMGKKTPMLFAPRTSLAGSIKQGVKVEFLPFPKITKETTKNATDTPYTGFGSTGYALSKLKYTKEKSADKQAKAFEFLKFIISEKGQIAFSKTGDCVPILKSLAIDQNADWRKFSVEGKFDTTGKNHDAFLTGGGTDLKAAYLQGYNAAKQVDLYGEYNELFKFLPDNYGGQGNLSVFATYANGRIALKK